MSITPNTAILGGTAATSFTPQASPVINDSIWSHVSGIQNVSITTGAGAQTITSGAFFNAAFAAGINLTSIAAGGAINIFMDGSNGGTLFNGAATVTATTSGAGAQTIDAGSGLTTVIASSNGGAQTIVGSNFAAVSAINTGNGAQTITSTGTGAVTVIATDVSGTQTITLGNGNNIVTDVTGSGAVTVIVGTGSNTLSIGAATATGNTSGIFNVTYGTHNSTGPDSITVGTGGTTYATAANYVITGAVTGDRFTFAADTASSNAALTTMGATTIASIEAAVAGHAHAVAYGLVGGNTYVAESVSGTLGITDTTLIELLGTYTLAAATGYVTVTPNPQTFTLTAGVGSFVATTAGVNTFNGTYSDGGVSSPTPNTFQIGDTITGYGTNNTLNITPNTTIGAGAAATSFTPQASPVINDSIWSHVSGIQNVSITTGAGAQTITSGAFFNAAFAAGGVNLTSITTGGAINIFMDGSNGGTLFTGVETITATTSGAGAQTIDTGSGLTTVIASANGGAQTIVGANLATASVTNTGNGAQTITSTGAGVVTLTAVGFSGAQTITTGAGNDILNVTLSAGAINTISTGAGNDTINLFYAAGAASTNTITGGLDADTISLGSQTTGTVDTLVYAALTGTNDTGSAITANGAH
ncbi:hypothetical protein F6R98_11935 [Candidatus Methylospira mobilis]|uniref:Uncharacterized protein n=1 Tax=Candidatus Methylospira mobilis TaxID=1808979 RepID=A0A5Q0BHE4_9GAMM|nr:hypothetical protein F6R98_11935 [Candidatus Methylospira mobilis]